MLKNTFKLLSLNIEANIPKGHSNARICRKFSENIRMPFNFKLVNILLQAGKYIFEEFFILALLRVSLFPLHKIGLQLECFGFSICIEICLPVYLYCKDFC